MCGKVMVITVISYKVETTVKAETNVRIRVRGTIIRIQITEARIRPIIRITTEQSTTYHHQPFYFHVNSRSQKSPRVPPLCSPSKTAQAETNVRIRVRGTISRSQITEARTRPITRITTEQSTIPAYSRPAATTCRSIEVVTAASI